MARTQVRPTRMRTTQLRLRMRTTRRPYTLEKKQKRQGNEPCPSAKDDRPKRVSVGRKPRPLPIMQSRF